MSEDRAEETKASYPDSSSVRDSRDGGSNESDEVEDGVGEGGQKLPIGAPLPKHLGHVVGNLCGVSSIQELVCWYRVLVGLNIFMVTVTKSLSCNPRSLTWVLVHLGHDLQCGPLLCPDKYWFTCYFFSNSHLHTIKSPLPPLVIF